MKTLSTLMLSSLPAVGGTALAAKDPDRVTGKDRAAQAGQDRADRLADRERNPNAAIPATPYPGEGKAATPATPAKKRTDDTTTDATSGTTGATTGSTTDSTSGGTTSASTRGTSGRTTK